MKKTLRTLHRRKIIASQGAQAGNRQLMYIFFLLIDNTYIYIWKLLECSFNYHLACWARARAKEKIAQIELGMSWLTAISRRQTRGKKLIQMK